MPAVRIGSGSDFMAFAMDGKSNFSSVVTIPTLEEDSGMEGLATVEVDSWDGPAGDASTPEGSSSPFTAVTDVSVLASSFAWWALLYRPARPPICLMSAMASGLCRKPSHFEDVSKMIRLMLLFNNCQCAGPAWHELVDSQVQAHANGIAGDEIVVIIVRIVEQTCLLSSGFGGKTAVNSGNLPSGGLFNLLPQSMNAHDTEADDAITLTQTLEIPIQALWGHLQRTQTLVLMDVEFLPNGGAEFTYQGHSAGLTAKVKLPGLDTEDGLSPGPASLWTANHLDLVNDGNVDGLVERHHFDGTALHVA